MDKTIGQVPASSKQPSAALKAMPLKAKIEYCVPTIALDVARFARAQIRYFRAGQVIQKNNIWRNRYLGDEVFVIGNGPSLKNVNRAIFRGKKVIVMNAFGRADWKEEVEIVAHCVGEPRSSSSWGRHIVENINETQSSSYWLHLSSCGQLQGAIDKKQLYYVLPSIEPGLWPRGKKIELHTATLGYATTAQLAIQVALYMGFKKIRLYGFDHSWLASPKFLQHFYSDNKDDEDTLDRHSYLSIIEFSLRMWRLYYKLREISTHHGAEILNKSDPSYLDVFDVQ